MGQRINKVGQQINKLDGPESTKGVAPTICFLGVSRETVALPPKIVCAKKVAVRKISGFCASVAYILYLEILYCRLHSSDVTLVTAKAAQFMAHKTVLSTAQASKCTSAFHTNPHIKQIDASILCMTEKWQFLRILRRSNAKDLQWRGLTWDGTHEAPVSVHLHLPNWAPRKISKIKKILKKKKMKNKMIKKNKNNKH